MHFEKILICNLTNEGFLFESVLFMSQLVIKMLSVMQKGFYALSLRLI